MTGFGIKERGDNFGLMLETFGVRGTIFRARIAFMAAKKKMAAMKVKNDL